MADEHLSVSGVAEIRLPAKFFTRSVGIAFDVGKITKLSLNARSCFSP